VPNFVAIGPTVAVVESGQNAAEMNFRFFKMAAAAIVDFSNFKLFEIRWLKRDELRCRAKFGRNLSKHA